MKTKLFIAVVSASFTFHSVSEPAIAESVNRALDEQVTFRIGPFWADVDATIRARGQDFEIDEGLSADSVDFAVYGLWRITPRWRVEAGYSAIESEGSDTLDSDVDLGLLTVPAGLRVDGKLETEVLRFALGYAFAREESWEAGVELGINYTTVKESFRVTPPGMSGTDLTTVDVSQPLPTIGLFFNYGLSPKWYWTSRAGVFAFDIGDMDGTIYNLAGGVEFRPWEQVGVGLSYGFNSADVTITDGGQKTDVEWEYKGPVLYLVTGF
jgi:opacity protein-like surface antigen